MLRGCCVVMLAGLFTAIGCEQKPGDRTSGKVTSEDVRRDAGQAADTAVKFSQQTKEEFQKSLDARLKELDTEIAKLREKGRDLKDEAKANWVRRWPSWRINGIQPTPSWKRSEGGGGLEGCPEGSPVGLGRIGKSLP